MKVVLVGTGTFVPSERRASPGVLLQAGGESILVDAGPGTVRRLVGLGHDYLDLDCVGVTHRHPDHTIDLLHLFFATRYAPDGPRAKPLTLFGPPGFGAFLGDLTAVYAEWMAADTYARRVVEMTPGSEMARPGWRVRAEEMRHLPVSLGYRFEAAAGGIVAITGDTELCDGAVRLATGADLLIVECSGPDGEPRPGHLTPSGVAAIVRESGVPRVVLVHILPRPDEEALARAVRAACGAEVVLGVDGQVLEAG